MGSAQSIHGSDPASAPNLVSERVGVGGRLVSMQPGRGKVFDPAREEENECIPALRGKGAQPGLNLAYSRVGGIAQPQQEARGHGSALQRKGLWPGPNPVPQRGKGVKLRPAGGKGTWPDSNPAPWTEGDVAQPQYRRGKEM